MRKRILVVRPVRIDKEEAASVAVLELHKSRRWTYNWLKENVRLLKRTLNYQELKHLLIRAI